MAVKIILPKPHCVIYSTICSVGWHTRLFLGDKWINPAKPSVLSGLLLGDPAELTHARHWGGGRWITCSKAFPEGQRVSSVTSCVQFSLLGLIQALTQRLPLLSLFQLIINGKMQVKGEAWDTETHCGLQNHKTQQWPTWNARHSNRSYTGNNIEKSLEKIQRNNRLAGKIHQNGSYVAIWAAYTEKLMKCLLQNIHSLINTANSTWK